MNKRIGILGSTGSIGCNSLEVISNLNEKGFNCEVVFLSTNNRTEILKQQVDIFKPKFVFIQNPEKSAEFRKLYGHLTEVIPPEKSLSDFIKLPDYDILVNALVGFAGLAPTLEAIKCKKYIALANKEVLVVAGELVNKLIDHHKIQLIPIDSEHSAILQCLLGENENSISKLILTASGGPFRTKSKEEIKDCSIIDALNHPNWNMGDKITIDSATMMNKGLEVIEAKWLFNMDVKEIEVIIHPQSIIHSFVEFKDSSVKAQLGIPDMKIPIQFALTYPERVPSEFPKLNFDTLKDLTFERPDLDKFECLKIAFETIKEGKTYPIVMNAANEVAVHLFLNGKIGFYGISDLIRKSLDSHIPSSDFDLDDIVRIDQSTRQEIFKSF
ncbi:MAG: 1-deoxy-D-xylulose-5-phosphate reductoisomerase [Ignavibacteriae bacterium]|nr:1-deoxy-D-xylulose-5-phosphate reductoisomerase [Ignavibacteriota bacterium]